MKQKKILSLKSTFLYLTCAVSFILFVGCSKDDSHVNAELYLSLPETPYDYVSLPTSGVPHPANDVLS